MRLKIGRRTWQSYWFINRWLVQSKIKELEEKYAVLIREYNNMSNDKDIVIREGRVDYDKLQEENKRLKEAIEKQNGHILVHLGRRGELEKEVERLNMFTCSLQNYNDFLGGHVNDLAVSNFTRNGWQADEKTIKEGERLRQEILKFNPNKTNTE